MLTDEQKEVRCDRARQLSFIKSSLEGLHSVTERTCSQMTMLEDKLVLASDVIDHMYTIEIASRKACLILEHMSNTYKQQTADLKAKGEY